MEQPADMPPWVRKPHPTADDLDLDAFCERHNTQPTYHDYGPSRPGGYYEDIEVASDGGAEIGSIAFRQMNREKLIQYKRKGDQVEWVMHELIPDLIQGPRIYSLDGDSQTLDELKKGDDIDERLLYTTLSKNFDSTGVSGKSLVPRLPKSCFTRYGVLKPEYNNGSINNSTSSGASKNFASHNNGSIKNSTFSGTYNNFASPGISGTPLRRTPPKSALNELDSELNYNNGFTIFSKTLDHRLKERRLDYESDPTLDASIMDESDNGTRGNSTKMAATTAPSES